MEVDNNVLVERLEGVTKLINEKFTENEKSHSAILAQTCKTNGRVNDLEGIKNKLVGALIMTNIVVLPIVYMMISNWLNK